MGLLGCVVRYSNGLSWRCPLGCRGLLLCLVKTLSTLVRLRLVRVLNLALAEALKHRLLLM